MTIINFFVTEHQYAYSPHCALHISYATVKENLIDNQERLKLVIKSLKW